MKIFNLTVTLTVGLLGCCPATSRRCAQNFALVDKQGAVFGMFLRSTGVAR